MVGSVHGWSVYSGKLQSRRSPPAALRVALDPSHRIRDSARQNAASSTCSFTNHRPHIGLDGNLQRDKPNYRHGQASLLERGSSLEVLFRPSELPQKV